MTKKREVFPPHPDAAIHARVLARLMSRTPAERRQALIDAGVLTESGELAEPYTKDPVLSYREPLTHAED
jgi:hypothetical protein